jgi:predicted dehydrogenase
VRIAVVGAGVMGANHVRIAASSQHIDLVAVVDPDGSRTAPLNKQFGVRTVDRLEEVIDDIDGLIVAAPTRFHHEIGMLEKPITTTTDEAAELVALAEQRRVVLMVGHVERFNPAILELPNVLDKPYHIEAFRMGPFSSRVPDDVVLDLMIHDIDIVLSIAKSPVVSVSAVGQRRKTESNDLVTALLGFENGLTASLTASRIGQQKVRMLRFTQDESVVTVDLLRQQVEINRVSHSEYLSDTGRRYRQSGIVEIPFVENRGEPLALELEEFVRAAMAGRSARVSGTDGLLALATATTIMNAVR